MRRNGKDGSSFEQDSTSSEDGITSPPQLFPVLEHVLSNMTLTKTEGIPVGLGYNIPLVLPWVVSMQPTNSPGSLFTLSFMTESDS